MQDQEIKQYLDTADRIRGVIISHTVLLERNIDEYLCNYFCSTEEKKWELMELVISERMDFHEKTEAFTEILRKNCIAKGLELKNEYPRIKTDFQEIAQARNFFAHTLLMPPDETRIKEKKFTLLKFKDKREAIDYTEAKIQSIFDRINKYSDLIKNLTSTDTANPSD
jgi:hypothetical protein